MYLVALSALLIIPALAKPIRIHGLELEQRPLESATLRTLPIEATTVPRLNARQEPPAPQEEDLALSEVPSHVPANVETKASLLKCDLAGQGKIDGLRAQVHPDLLKCHMPKPQHLPAHLPIKPDSPQPLLSDSDFLSVDLQQCMIDAWTECEFHQVWNLHHNSCEEKAWNVCEKVSDGMDW